MTGERNALPDEIGQIHPIWLDEIRAEQDRERRNGIIVFVVGLLGPALLFLASFYFADAISTIDDWSSDRLLVTQAILLVSALVIATATGFGYQTLERDRDRLADLIVQARANLAAPLPEIDWSTESDPYDRIEAEISRPRGGAGRTVS